MIYYYIIIVKNIIYLCIIIFLYYITYAHIYILYNNIKLFIDINYVETNLSLILKNKNIDIVSGKAMFIYQALKTYEIWFGKHNSSYDEIKRLLDK